MQFKTISISTPSQSCLLHLIARDFFQSKYLSKVVCSRWTKARVIVVRSQCGKVYLLLNFLTAESHVIISAFLSFWMCQSRSHFDSSITYGAKLEKSSVVAVTTPAVP